MKNMKTMNAKKVVKIENIMKTTKAMKLTPVTTRLFTRCLECGKLGEEIRAIGNQDLAFKEYYCPSCAGALMISEVIYYRYA
jgi:predicted SprT family Zn-dependent metalloprotease